MLLAAGRGERMQPLTRSLPKPAIPVLGRPVLAQVLARLARNGFREAAVNVFHHPEGIEAMLGDGSSLGLETLHYSREPELLGTAGGLRHAAGFLRGHGPFVVRNADFLADVDVGALARAHAASGCEATLALAPARAGYTAVRVDGDGRVAAFGERPPTPPGVAAASYLFTGYHVLEENVLDRIPPSGPSDIVLDVYLELVSQRRLATFVHDGFWWEFGTPETYLEGSIALLELPPGRRRAVAETDPVRDLRGFPAALGPGAEIDPAVRLGGPVVLGARSRAAAGSFIARSVVMDGVVVESGAELDRCIVGPGVRVPAGVSWSDTLVCADPAPADPPSPATARRDGLLHRALRFEDVG